MEISHIEHIGIAVPSLEEAIPFYENILGLKCFAIEEVADQKVKTAFFKVGQTKIELLEGTAPESAICKFMDRPVTATFRPKAAAASSTWLSPWRTVWPTHWPRPRRRAASSSTRHRVPEPKGLTSPSCIPNRP